MCVYMYVYLQTPIFHSGSLRTYIGLTRRGLTPPHSPLLSSQGRSFHCLLTGFEVHWLGSSDAFSMIYKPRSRKDVSVTTNTNHDLVSVVEVGISVQTFSVFLGQTIETRYINKHKCGS